MKYCLILYLVLFTSCWCLAQKHDYVWLFGYDSHLGYPEVEGITMNFNEMPVSISYTPRQMSMGSSNASICDSSGNLVFYTNGCYIANNNNEVMENGDGLNPGEVHDIQCTENYTAGIQSCLILPMPNSDSIYFLLHKGIVYDYTPSFEVITDVLYYSKVNSKYNNGAGKVIEKNSMLILDTLESGQLTAVRHSNGNDWWVIVPEYLTQSYYILLFTPSGISIFSQQQIGNVTSSQSQGGGQAVFSPDGSKYIRYNPIDGIFIFEFDRFNGYLYGFQHIEIDDGAFAGGAAVSSNSRYLYISSEQYLYQFDLQSSDIGASKLLIATYDGYLSPLPTVFFQSQLAPDCKIYISSYNTVDVLHVINNPDEPGIACNFEQHVIQLPFNYRRFMPNFPNYRLGPLIPGETPDPPCSPIVRTEEPLPAPEPAINVFPNPASGQLTLSIETPANGEWQLFQADGRLALRQLLQAGRSVYEIDVAVLPPGMYFYRVFLEGEPAGSGKVSVVR